MIQLHATREFFDIMSKDAIRLAELDCICLSSDGRVYLEDRWVITDSDIYCQIGPANLNGTFVQAVEFRKEGDLLGKWLVDKPLKAGEFFTIGFKKDPYKLSTEDLYNLLKKKHGDVVLLTKDTVDGKETVSFRGSDSKITTLGLLQYGMAACTVVIAKEVQASQDSGKNLTRDDTGITQETSDVG